MGKQFYILIGRSGSGKGTQAGLLSTYLTNTCGSTVNHITTGGGFRDFIAGNSYTASLSKKINEEGELQPEFLAVWNWSNIFINSLKGNETVILDGAPRKPFEVSVLHSAVHFYGYTKPVVLYLDVTEQASREHLALRGRDDDKEEHQVSNRMKWFEEDVLAALAVYTNDPRYQVVHINGNQSIDDVHKEIVEKLKNLA